MITIFDNLRDPFLRGLNTHKARAQDGQTLPGHIHNLLWPEQAVVDHPLRGIQAYPVRDIALGRKFNCPGALSYPYVVANCEGLWSKIMQVA